MDRFAGNGSPSDKITGEECFDKIILAEGITPSFNSGKTGLNNNIVVLGTTGCGKSMSISEPQIIHTENNSLVVTVTKRVLADKYTNYLRSKGMEVDILNLADPHRSTIGFDPLDYIVDESDIISLAKQVIYSGKKQNTNRDPYWDDSAVALVCAEISALAESWADGQRSGQDSPAPSLDNLLELHRRLRFFETDRSGFTTSTLDSLFDRLEKGNPKSYAVRSFKTVRGLNSKTVSCIQSTVDVAYSQVFTPSVCAAARKSGVFNPLSLGKKKSALFIVTSPIEKSTKHFANIIYSTLFRYLFDLAENSEGYRLPVPVHMICDDFACGSTIPDFADYISVIRSAGISVALLIQSESQLEDLYGVPDAHTILDNCDRTVYLGGNNLPTCSSIAKRANVPLEEVINMPLGKAYVFERGRKAVYTDRYHTTEDPIWGMVDREAKKTSGR